MTGLFVVAVAAVVARGVRTRSHRARRLGRPHAPRAWLPPRWRDRLAGALGDAEVTAAPEDAVVAWIAGAVAVTVVAAAFAPALAVLALPATLAAGPLSLRLRRHRRGERLRDAVPEVLDEVARELRAGSTIGVALDRASAGGADHDVPLAPYREARAGGATAAEAVTAWAAAYDRAPAWLATPVAAAAAALVTAITTGGRSAYALEGVAEALRAEADAGREAHAQSAQGRASAIVLGGLAPASLVLGAAVEPRSVGVLLTHPVGNGALVGGLVCELLGVWWMRHILDAR